MCKSCNVLVINGIKCHEQGCPDAWKEEMVECVWCGEKFLPDAAGQKYCCDSCAGADLGYYVPDEEDYSLDEEGF